jgi:putative two-component system response regulator
LIGELRGPEEYLPVLILSADATSKARIGALSAGATDFLTKPLDTTEVGLRVLNYLETRRLHLRLEEQRRNLHNSMANASVRDTSGDISELGLDKTGPITTNGIPAGGLDEIAVDVPQASGTSHWSVASASHRLLLAAGGSPEDAAVLEKAVHLQRLVRWGILDVARTLTALDQSAESVARSIAGNHFERWDGTGDPASLQGKEIPVEARAVAVCDTFMALVTDIPGKPAISIGTGIETLEMEKGKILDPDLVDLFLDEVLPFMLRSMDLDAQPADRPIGTQLREDCGLAG